MKTSIGTIISSGEDFQIEGGKHIVIIGGTGTGKSTLMERMIIENVRAGDGVILIDPHGPVAEGVADHIPKTAVDRVIYFHPKSKNPIGFNPLDSVDADLSRDSFESLIQTIWPSGWGAETANILANTLKAISETIKKPTTAHLYKFIVDTKWRKRITSRVKSPEVKLYFDNLYDGEWDKRMRTEKSAPFLNKINRFNIDSKMRLIMGQPDSLDFRRVMDSSQVLLINLAKGEIGGELAEFLGGVAVHKSAVAAFSRANIPKHQRRNVYIYIDEFASLMAAMDVSTFLAETRKYNVFLILGTQTIAMLEKKTLQVILGNCATQIVYRVSAEDSLIFEHQFASKIPASAFQELNDFEFYVRTIKSHIPIGPYKLQAHPPIEKRPDDAERQAVINQSGDNHGTPRAKVDSYLKDLFSE